MSRSYQSSEGSPIRVDVGRADPVTRLFEGSDTTKVTVTEPSGRSASYVVSNDSPEQIQKGIDGARYKIAQQD